MQHHAVVPVMLLSASAFLLGTVCLIYVFSLRNLDADGANASRTSAIAIAASRSLLPILVACQERRSLKPSLRTDLDQPHNEHTDILARAISRVADLQKLQHAT